MTNPAPPEADEQLLAELFSHGLASVDVAETDPEATDEAIKRYRKLLRVLIDYCVLRPLSETEKSEPLQEKVIEQARLSLSVVARHAAACPDLLLYEPDDIDTPGPFYGWLITRALIAAVGYGDIPGGEALVKELERCIDHILLVLGRDLGDSASSMIGPHRVTKVLNELVTYAHVPEGEANLFGYTDLPLDIAADVLALNAVLQTSAPFAAGTRLNAAKTLSSLRSKLPQTSPQRQALYVSVVEASLRNAEVRHVLTRAATTVVQLPEEGERLQSALVSLLKGLEASDDLALRRDVWWALRDGDVTSIPLDSPVVQQKVLYLLGPIANQVHAGGIEAALERETLEHWSQQATSRNLLDIRERLKRFMKVPPPISLKRKRDDSSVEASVMALLRAKMPDFRIEGDLLDSFPLILENLGPTTAFKLLENTPSIACALAQCDDHHEALRPEIANAWLKGWNSVTDDRVVMRTLGVLFLHRNTAHTLSQSWAKILWRSGKAMSAPDRRTRIAAGNLISAIYKELADSDQPQHKTLIQREITSRFPSLLSGSLRVQETALHLLGDIGRGAPDKDLGYVLETLIRQLGSPNTVIRSLSYAQLVGIASSRKKQPYNLISPYMDRISVILAECIVPHPAVVAEVMQFIGYNRATFFQLDAARKAVIPALVVEQNRPALEALECILNQRLGLILIEEGADILAKIFLTPKETQASLNFVTTLLGEATNNKSSPQAILNKYIQASIVPLLVKIVVELGDKDKAQRDIADLALNTLQAVERERCEDLGTYLKPHMLGVLAPLTEHLMTPRIPVEHRVKIIRSIGFLIELVGDSMASFSPQIIASLQSTLEIPELRLPTLQTWCKYVELLRYSAVGPYIGATIAALVANWDIFDRSQREQAQLIIGHIAGNAKQLEEFRDDIVRFDHIPELDSFNRILLDYRKDWAVTKQLEKLIERTDSKNIAIATESMREMRNLLKEKHSDVMRLAQGDAFEPVLGQTVRSLLSAVTRAVDCEDLRDLAYECFGIVGALDPDRFATGVEETSILISSNFTDADESANFAIHLIRDLLADAFRSTNDPKHQNNLAFAIQELMKFCGFDSRIVKGGNVPSKVQRRWKMLPEDVLKTVNPLLDAQFKQNQIKTRTFEYPIYSTKKTYREWIQAWTVGLIGRVMEVKHEGETNHAQRIFGVFLSEPKNQDVAVAHHLLPHLVLHVLLSGDAIAREQIREEIWDVLRDQVSPAPGSTPEKRMLSAQVIFQLMDHLSKSLRLSRNSDKERRSASYAVDQLISSIDKELMANAAMKSRSFARSLRSFEERVIHLRTREHKTNKDLQTYFESLHEIYAELDEPDGMEGVSAFVVAPSLELQIREHESTGRWTSAQSCWEVRLQQSPEDLKLHVGLLKCLKNLGHYDTLRTHIQGVLRDHPDWADELAPFRAEAALAIGDWATVKDMANPPPIAKAFLAIGEKGSAGVSDALKVARREIGSGITTRDYGRAYETLLQLHMLREAEMIHNTDMAITHPTAEVTTNANAIARRQAASLVSSLAQRFDTALPSFRAREEILSKRRTAFRLVKSQRLQAELGQAWILSAKIARKAGYEQTAYSAALQAEGAEAPFAFIQRAKVTRMQGGILKALREIEHPVQDLVVRAENAETVIDLTSDSGESRKTQEDFRRERNLAKAVLLEARWQNEADRFEQNGVIRRFKKATQLGENLEAPFFHLGRYYDTLAGGTSNIEEMAVFNFHTCLNYHEALQRGVKYIFQTMPRLLTVWLDLGESKDIRRSKTVEKMVADITKLMDRSRGKIMSYQFLTAFPQMISRITHTNKEVQEALVKLIYRVIRDYPAQSLWPAVGAIQSRVKARRDIMDQALRKAINNRNEELRNRIEDARRLSDILLRLAEDKPQNKVREVSINKQYPYVRDAFPSQMILPMQDVLTVLLPATGATMKGHNPFPQEAVTIRDISDLVEIMPSLQMPKKLVFKGSDGKRYPFLCKPHDDLRKDARLMDFDAMINKFLKSGSEARRRHLYIRTYAVMPLNEECGLLEWVTNTNALNSILEKGYARYGKKVYTTEIYTTLEHARKGGNPHRDVPMVFRDKILPMFNPTVFHEWFLLTWPEPTAWLTARTNYARTLAVMSMIGYVLGLGDRHGENILFDGLTGDTVHVDLNCLFDRAKTFEVPERVPFRLTHNMVDALGVTGVEGSFRKAAEITMDILRQNGDSLMSVLEAFIHDPLVEWTKKKSADVRAISDKSLKPIHKKLRGVSGDTAQSVPNQVESLIKQATSDTNLGLMYVGWKPWL